MNKIKVLILCASLKIGGAEKVAQSIALCAPEDQFEFHYLVFHENVGEYEAALTERGCLIHRFAEPSDNYWAFFRDLSRLIREHRFQVVHAHTMFNCGLVMLASKLQGVPVRISHAHSALKNGHNPVKAVYEKLMRLLILSCSTDLVSCGIEAGNRLFGKSSFQKRGQLILNGVDVPAFAYSGARRNEIRDTLHAEDRFILGHAGHLSQVKNQAFLLDLMPQILAERPDALLLLLGEGEDRPMLEQRISQLGLQQHVILTGNVANVADYLSAMDVFVFPSLFEGMPLSILEVQANGLPCVISTGVPEDVFLTDLIHPLSLDAPQTDWIHAILSAGRKDCMKYNQQLLESDFSTDKAMEKIYRIYSQG